MIDKIIYPLFVIVMVIMSFLWGGTFKQARWVPSAGTDSRIKCIEDRSPYDVFEVCYKIKETSRKVTRRLNDYTDKRTWIDKVKNFFN